MKKGSHHSRKSNIKNALAHIGKVDSLETTIKRSESKLGEKNSFYGKKHTKLSLDKMSKSHTGKILFIKDPIAYFKSRMNNLNNIRKSSNTKLEIKVHEHVQTIIDKPIFTQVPIPISHETIYVVDFLIPDLKTVIEVNGCYWHYCVKCHPLQPDIYKAMDKQHADIQRKFNLERMGFKVIVIWEHDINNEKYKKILNRELL